MAGVGISWRTGCVCERKGGATGDLSSWKNGGTNTKWARLQAEQVWGWQGRDPEFCFEHVTSHTSSKSAGSVAVSGRELTVTRLNKERDIWEWMTRLRTREVTEGQEEMEKN